MQSSNSSISAEKPIALIQSWIEKWLVENLEISPDVIDPNLPLNAYGMESLMILELIQDMEDWLGQSLREVDWTSSNPTITNIAVKVADTNLNRSPIKQLKPGVSMVTSTPQSEQSANLGVSSTLSDALQQIPQTFNTVSNQRDRQLLIENRWVCDFASCNYLGLDLHPQVAQTIPAAVSQWGTHPSWTRAVASPQLYQELETAIADLIDAPDVLVFPSLTLLHMGVIPSLTQEDGIIFVDAAAHRSVYEACRLSKQNGAIVIQHRHNHLEDLTQKLHRYAHKRTKLIVIDGVYSMSGTCSNLQAYTQLAKEFDALLYIDDAHGFGLLGEHPTLQMPYGLKGNGIVKHFGCNYDDDRIIYSAGLSKAFSSYGAFVTCTNGSMKSQFANAWTAVFSGPIPTASLASAIAGLEVNSKEGDQRRQRIYHLTRKLVAAARSIGFQVDNQYYFPIVSVVVGSVNCMQIACQQLWQHGILITPAIFPAVPVNRSALRFSITAANTEAEVEQAIRALQAVWDQLCRCQSLAS
ncbi:aminotransferase class I/II-fold pyridoxal phosphate-dependent enzyme [Thermocoleostomius sinensis]|uniref:Aminotransferase class I/II-fold pyridoxal phosphate-dependent enzyme n=1 Tax=Thermocoleostomius sinensis A174 TaxID=2016057 RepID=A0A9E9C786_9CYAN|nr:aminotransferase class I/II-fold pyridoxal phosphate-dependent enzyme [Thermocoleostomius sinensis]WAL60079.1 aminotransferase class I/II-fold pyridoxal phosphate-dependent enzyme [Thermocoleostomius sinensis A174]